MSEQNPYLLYPDHQMDRRPRYYDGQFLKADDFNDVQRYEIDRRRRHLEATVRAGVVSGLDLTPAPDQITVSAGAAIDDIGRQIVLVEAQSKAIAAEDRGETLLLYIAWSETASDEAEGDEGTAGFTRFHELPAIGYVQSGAALPAHAVVLATVNIDADGNVELDTAARPRAGLRIPGPTPLTLTSDEADPGRATFAAALRLTVPDGTAHDPEAPALDVAGHARIAHGLVIGQDSATGYQGITNDGDDLIIAGRLAAAAGSTLPALGVGYAPPQAEGTLATQRLAVGDQALTAGYTFDVTGDARVDGALDVTQQLTLSAPLLIEGAGATIGGDATIDGALDVTGRLDADGLAVDGATTLGGDVDLDGALAVHGTLGVESGVLDLGAGVAGRHENAGKILYNGLDIAGLSVFGAGTSVDNRKINLYAAGGIVAAGPTDIDGALTATSLVTDAAITAGTTLTAHGKATLNGGFEAVGNGSVTGRLIVGQTSTHGYRNVIADENDLIVEGRIAAGGSAGSAVYSLGVGADAQNNKEGYLFVGNRIGVNTTDPQRRIDVDGTARFTGNTEVGGDLIVDGVLDLGAKHDGRQSAAGKIAYDNFREGEHQLELVGGGTSNTNRKIQMWAEGGLLLNGTARFTGATQLDGTLAVTGKVTTADDLTVGGVLYADAGEGRGISFGANVYGGSGDVARISYWRPGNTGEDTRFEIKTLNDNDDIIVLSQKSTDVITLRNGRCGIRESDPDDNLHVSGRIKIDNDYAVVAPGDKFRVCFGVFAANGSASVARGLSCFQAGPGQYRIEFDTAFQTPPACFVLSGSAFISAAYGSLSTTRVDIVLTSTHQVAMSSSGFTVMVIGEVS